MRIVFDPRPRRALTVLLIATAVLTAFSLCGVYLKHAKVAAAAIVSILTGQPVNATPGRAEA